MSTATDSDAASPAGAPTADDPVSRAEAVIETVSRWPGVTVAPHRDGGRVFRLGSREVGRLTYGGVLDVAFQRDVREALLGVGRTDEGRRPGSGAWTTFRLRSADDVERAVDLLRISCLYHALSRARTPEGQAVLSGIDLDAELEHLALPPGAAGRFDLVREHAGS